MAETVWQFRSIFSGLVAFAPSQDRMRMYALLVDTTKIPDRLHNAQLRFDNRYLEDGPHDGKDIVQPLDKVTITFVPDAGVVLPEPFLPLDLERPCYQLQPTVENARDVSWLADLARIYPTASGINQACLASNPTGSGIIARTDIEHGPFGTESFGTYFTGSPPIWFFAPENNPLNISSYKQSVAIDIFNEFAVPAGRLSVVGTGFDGEQRFSYSLAPYVEGDPVVVHIENVPDNLEEAVRIIEDYEMDVDFALFYALSSITPPVPVPWVPERIVVSGKDGTDPGAQFPRQNCIPVAFGNQ